MILTKGDTFMSQFVKKRNGTIVPFDAFKIKSAITKANILNDVGPSELLNDQKLSLLTSEISNQILKINFRFSFIFTVPKKFQKF